MNHIFVSHSSAQRELAEHVARFLERRGISCWLAPRDIAAGQDFDQAILSAIASCSAILLLFSEEADESAHVRRELALADDAKKFLLTLRVQDVFPKLLAYWLKLGQRLDWLDRRDETLHMVVERLRDLSGGSGPAAVPGSRESTPERLVEPKVAPGTRGFAPKLTVETAVYMGRLFEGAGVFEKALNVMFGSKRKVDKVGFNIRNFDWNDHVFVRPCDVHLGADRWDAGNGLHKAYINYSNESWATTYSVILSDGVLFGNGNTLVFGGEGAVQRLTGNTDGAFAVDAGHTFASWIDDKSHSIRFVRKDRYGVLTEGETAIPADLRWHLWKFMLCAETNGKNSALFYYGSSLLTDNAGEMRPLARLAAETGTIEAQTMVAGLQNIAPSPGGDRLAVITVDDILLLDADRLQLIEKMPIRDVREEDYYVLPPIAYSPCGRFLAYSVAKTGDIEILDAASLTKLGRLRTDGGLPKAAFGWSCDGRFLAAGMFYRAGGPNKLLVWNIEDWQLVTVVSGLRGVEGTSAYSNRPGTFQWDRFRPEFALLLGSGDIIRYKLDS